MRDNTMRRNPILLLGDPRLRKVSAPSPDPHNPDIRKTADLISRTLASFRTKYGFGHGIAAPQVGIPQRIIAVRLGSRTVVLLNPEITWQSDETTILWDSCMCFPFLIVRVMRPASLTLTFSDLSGTKHTWEQVNPWLSALLAHEVDHLNGVLAIDHSIDKDSLVAREVYEANPAFYQEQVDQITVPFTPDDNWP
jgi:peptide deformylase